jgi:Ca-activated chloride channel family protein
MKKLINIESRILLTIALSSLIGCASNLDVNTDQETAGASINHSPSGLSAPKAVAEDVAAMPVSEEYEFVAERAMAVDRASSRKKVVHKVHALAAMPSPMNAGHHLVADIANSYYQDENRETYASVEQSAVKQVSESPVSTFSIDVDTGSYSNIRRMLTQGSLPPVDAVRIEEMINYFDYSYQAPKEKQAPFSIHTELAISPWSAGHALLRIGLKGYEPEALERPASNLVFLLDVSGSMNSPDKLPLLKKSLVLLSKQLKPSDKVSIVVYAGASGVVLEPTDGNQALEIEQALENLSAGGSTNGQAGIQLAYQLAKKFYDPNGINRVILATDGDFNVGTRNVDELKELIQRNREAGISLTTLGFGSGNYNDHLMEQLADVGNGNYAYIDSFNEARKVLVEELSATLMTIAKDVKIQVEFNPAIVKEYRLLGYENRALAREDFNNDKVDAGEVGAGHTVTALYEIVLQGSQEGRFDALRYRAQGESDIIESSELLNELAFIKFRYKALNSSKSKLISRPIETPRQLANFESASENFRFSATVAHFGESLRHSKYVADVDYKKMIQHASNAKGADPFGYRSEFIQLVRLASTL